MENKKQYIPVEIELEALFDVLTESDDGVLTPEHKW